MLNTLTLNTGMLNTGTPTPSAVVAADFDNLEFNGYSLQTDDVISSQIEAFSMPSRELVTYKIPRADGEGLNGDYFRGRRIKVSGIIERATNALLETELDTFKQAMVASEGNLDLKVNDEVRRIKATVENPEAMFAKREGYHISFTPFEMSFLALEPMWHSLDYQSETYEDVTSLVYPAEIEVSGSYKAQPVIIIILQTATSVTAINFENTMNGDAIEITAAFAADDVLIIDSEEKSVTLNGVEVDYDGVFPELVIGTNEFEFTVAGSAVQYTATVKYRKTYL